MTIRVEHEHNNTPEQSLELAMGHQKIPVYRWDREASSVVIDEGPTVELPVGTVFEFPPGSPWKKYVLGSDPLSDEQLKEMLIGIRAIRLPPNVSIALTYQMKSRAGEEERFQQAYTVSDEGILSLLICHMALYPETTNLYDFDGGGKLSIKGHVVQQVGMYRDSNPIICGPA